MHMSPLVASTTTTSGIVPGTASGSGAVGWICLLPLSVVLTHWHGVGDGHKGPPNNQGKPAYFRKKQNANEPKTHAR
jgi:hypothetical protein